MQIKKVSPTVYDYKKQEYDALLMGICNDKQSPWHLHSDLAG